jgi:hypothetical protein
MMKKYPCNLWIIAGEWIRVQEIRKVDVAPEKDIKNHEVTYEENNQSCHCRFCFCLFSGM